MPTRSASREPKNMKKWLKTGQTGAPLEISSIIAFKVAQNLRFVFHIMRKRKIRWVEDDLSVSKGREHAWPVTIRTSSPLETGARLSGLWRDVLSAEANFLPRQANENTVTAHR